MPNEDCPSRRSALAARQAKLTHAQRELLAKRLRGKPQAARSLEYRHEAAGLPRISPRPGERHAPFPLSDLQQAYWIGRSAGYDVSNVGSHGYLEADVAGAELDLDRLNRAWHRLIERHDKLRAVIQPDGRQRVLEEVPPFDIAVVDLRSRDPEMVATEVAAIRAEMSHQLFRTDQWPLFDIRAAMLDGPRTRLFISIELLVCDIWSLKILVTEWMRLYLRPDVALPPLEVSYRDYVLAKAALKDSEDYRQAVEYWKERVPALPPAPELPLAKSPSAVKHPRFECLRGRLAAERWRRLKRRAGLSGITPSGVLLAAFAEVLAAWSKSPRFTVNVPLFNRLPLHPQVNDLVGDFTALTFVAFDGSSREPFETRAQRLQEQLWENFHHSRCFSGVEVLRELARLRGRGSGAIMPIVFSSTTMNQNAGDNEGVMTNLPGEVVYVLSQTPQVYIDYQVWPERGSLVFTWNAFAEIFPPGLLESMFDAYQGFVARLADDPAAWRETTRGHLLPPGQAAERAAVNATDAPVPEGLLQTGFEEQARLHPERPAVVAPRVRLTYGDVEARANRVARRLRALGTRPGTIVAVAMEKGWEQIVAVLGALKSGAAYVPLDPKLPSERFAWLIRKADVRIALTQAALDASLDWPDGVARLVIDDETTAEGDGAPLEAIQRPTDLAYVIFTSGSTGAPKGVMVEHRGVLNNVRDVMTRFGFGPDDRVLSMCSLTFDVSVIDILGTLGVGGVIVLPDPARLRDPEHWVELMACENVTVWDSVPALLQMLLEWIGDRPGLLPQSLRLALLSGDWIPVSLPGRLRALVDGVRVASMGGNTEVSIWSFCHPIETVDPEWKSIPYGKPMVNQRGYVLDEHLQDRPVWVPGELYIGGVGLARSYWKDEEMTRASFVVHPRTGERLYRTGDFARWLPDGTIEFLGREDLQVKIRGYRVELGEIEATLRQHPGVSAVAAATVGEERGDKRLVAYVVSADEKAAPTSAELRAFLRAKLPEYMVPAVFVTLTALPLTANGKLDRAKLPSPIDAALATEQTVDRPRTPLEEELAGLWVEALHVDRVGVHDNFFELGGDSAIAVQLFSRIRERYEVEVPLRVLLEEPTVAVLANAIDRMRRGERLVVETSERDLEADSLLDPTIRPRMGGPHRAEDLREVVLTGATGFLGAFLLRELLEQTSATVHCLVRAATPDDGLRRLRANLASYGLWEGRPSDRIVPLVGDLRQPLLGLPRERFEAIAGEMDAVYHCGALVNFAYPYAALKAANVLGTQEVLRLACSGRTKVLHYVSSMMIFASAETAPGTVRENDVPKTTRLYTGYAETKWVAERLVTSARSRGLPVCIYRSGNVTGHSRTGSWNAQDLPPLFLRGCVQLGSVPELDLTWDMTPVDYVSRAILHLSLRRESQGMVFHLTNPSSLRLGQLVDMLARLGYPFRRLPYADWRAELAEALRRGEANDLAPLLPVFAEEAPRLFDVDCRNTLEALEGTGIACPPLDAALLRMYVTSLVAQGLLPPPRGAVLDAAAEATG